HRRGWRVRSNGSIRRWPCRGRRLGDVRHHLGHADRAIPGAVIHHTEVAQKHQLADDTPDEGGDDVAGAVRLWSPEGLKSVYVEIIVVSIAHLDRVGGHGRRCDVMGREFFLDLPPDLVERLTRRPSRSLGYRAHGRLESAGTYLHCDASSSSSMRHPSV